jgi:hypothetical protein
LTLTRILGLCVCRPVHELAKTDIAEYACGALYNSRIEEVDIIARRGPVQVQLHPKP